MCAGALQQFSVPLNQVQQEGLTIGELRVEPTAAQSPLLMVVHVIWLVRKEITLPKQDTVQLWAGTVETDFLYFALTLSFHM